ncbi:hypothetical protein CYY_005670 [Polysphondylium violaceum]|uniref:Uncharacterized protein n=1 Tax=Polysphondylium violaceum TaxID=133409 RepID=A0A8J4PUQ0_9MYCE|nr:hypothetical protein CYY_005670 [Polysphondylium violaceum]
MDPSLMPIPPQPWTIVSSNTGRLFYFNPMTQQQSVVPPPGSVPVQQHQIPQQPISQPIQQQQQPFIKPINSNNSSGNNSLNSSSSSLIKQSLPEGWEEDIDPQGRVYYIDHINKITSWIHPSVSQSLHSNTPKLNASNNSNVATTPIPSNNSNSSSSNTHIAYPSFNEYNNNVYNVNSPMVSSSLPKVIPVPIQKPPQSNNSNNSSNNNNSDSYRPRNISAPSPPIRVASFTPTTSSTPTTTTTVPSKSSPNNGLLSHNSPLWDLEKLVPSCSNCYVPFTVIKRRHHCRCCYREFCDPCTLQRIKIPQFDFTDPVRVCDYCYNHTSANEKTCISRLIPYLFDNYRDVNQQYQALLEIYDFVLSNQNHPTSIEHALVGGLKPFLEFVVRSTKDKDKHEAVALCCQVMAFTCKYEKLLKFISDKDQIISLFEVMATSSNSSVITDCAKVIKAILIKLKSTTSSGTTSTNSTPSTKPIVAPTTANNNATAANNAVVDLLISKSCITQFMTTLEQQGKPSKSKDEIQLECLKIVKRLVQHENTALALVESAAIEVITPLLLSSRQDIIKRVLKTLLTFVEYDNKNSEKIAASGGVLYLSELFLKQMSPNNNIYILMLLNYITKSKYSSMIIESEGLVDNLLEPFNSNVNSKEFKELIFLIDSLFKANSQQQQNQTYISQVICNHKEFLNALVNQCTRVPELESISMDILVNLCLVDECKEILRSMGIIDPLLSVICEKSKSPIIPLKILGNLAKNNLEVCSDIFEVGGLTVLIDLLVAPPPQPTKKPVAAAVPTKVPYSGDIDDLINNTLEDKEKQDDDEKKLKEYTNTQMQVVKLLAMLSYSKNIVKEFVNFENGNGIKTLVSLMNPSKDDAIKEIATEALSNLCENETCAILVISEGGLNYAMGLLSSNQTQIKTNTLKLIQKLVLHSPDIKLAISEGTSIQKIVEMLGNSANPELKKCAVFSLAELCRENESNRDLAFKCGCLPTLVSLFNTYTQDIKTLVCVLEILSGFVAQNEQYKTMILNTDLIQSIIEYLFTSGVNGNNDSFVIQSQVHSVHILSLLIKENSDLVKRVLDSGIILSLIPLLSINNSYLQEYTLATLKKISKSTTSEIRDTMISSGILSSLSNLLQSKNESILTNNLFILIELSKSQDCGGFLLSTNAVAQISELVISPNTPQTVKELSILLISSLFETSSNNSNIWEVFTSKAGIPGIVALLSSSNSSLAVSAANSLSTIVVDGPGRARVVESGGLPAILLAMKSPDVNLASSSLITIYGLSLEDELCEFIVNMGALDSLASMLSNDYRNTINVDTKLYACETIYNLSSNQVCRSLICQNSLIIQSMFDLLFSENPNHKNAACKTIALLATDATTAKFVTENGGLIGLVPLLSASQDEMTQLSSSMALVNLVKNHPESKSEILTSTSEDGSPGISSIIKILGGAGDSDAEKQHSVVVDLQILELLELLCDDPKFPSLVQSNEGMTSLLSLLIATSSRKESTNKEEAHNYCTILFKTLSIIVYLSANQEIRKSLLSNDFLKTLSSLLTPPPETLVSLDDTSALSSLLDIQEKESTTKQPTSNILKSIESNEDKEEINKLSLSLIYTLAISEEGKHSIRNSNLISLVVRFLSSKIDDQICISLKTLTLLSLSSLNRVELFNSGGFDRILDLLCNSNHQQVLLYSLHAINNLVVLEQNYSTFIKRDCLQHIIKCISIQYEPLQLISITLINRHLSVSKCIDDLIEKYGFITLLVNILNNASSEHLILLVLKTMNDMIPYDCARTSIASLLPKEILVALQTVPNLSLRELSSNLLAMGSCLP